MKQNITLHQKRGFTLVELMVVVIVIGILAAVVIVAYHGWRESTAESVMQSDLNGAAAAMENAKNWSNGYPTTIPSTFTASKDVTLTGGGSSDGTTFCITATSTEAPDASYYINNTMSQAASGACSAGETHIEDGKTLALTDTITSGGYNTAGITYAPDGTAVIVANSSSESISFINPADNTVPGSLNLCSGPQDVAITPDNSKIYVSCGTVIDMNTGSTLATISGLDTSVDILAFTPNGSTLYAVHHSATGTVSVVNTSTNTVIKTISVGSWPTGSIVSPDGSKVYVSNEADGTISIINTTTNTVSSTIDANGGPEGLALSPDGSLLYIANDDNTVTVMNTSTNNVTATINVGAGPGDIALSPDGARLYVINESDKTMSVINTATSSVASTIAISGGVNSVAVSPDGLKLYVSSSANVISVFTWQ